MNSDDLPPEFNDQPIILPIEDTIDLHTFAPKEIKELVEEYLYQCYQHGFPQVRIIHGKGIGVQREIVRSLLDKSPYVESFTDAGPEAGGWGATIAILKIDKAQ
ncbi:MAG: Smr/MutS family protein [Acidobacteriota bacterium]